jgi:hypothetical protein
MNAKRGAGFCSFIMMITLLNGLYYNVNYVEISSHKQELKAIKNKHN